MRLINHNEEEIIPSCIVIDSNDIKRELNYTSDELRIVEEKFYKIFDLNPCPMTIGDLKTGDIIDVNDAFLQSVGFKNKEDIIGKSTTKLKIISDKNKSHIIREINKDGFLKNYFCEFKTINGKKKKGLFSGTIIKLKEKDCLMLICQVVTKGFLSSVFKTYLTF